MPFSLRTEGFVDNPNRFAFLNGPVVLAAQVEPGKPFPAAVSAHAQATQARGESLFQRGLIPRDQYESQKASAAALAATVEADKAAVENARLNLQFAAITAPLSGRTGALNVHVGDLIRANDTTPLVVIPIARLADGERAGVRSVIGGVIAVLGAVVLTWTN